MALKINTHTLGLKFTHLNFQYLTLSRYPKHIFKWVDVSELHLELFTEKNLSFWYDVYVWGLQCSGEPDHLVRRQDTQTNCIYRLWWDRAEFLRLSTADTWRWAPSCWGGRPGPCGELSSDPVLHPPDACSTPSSHSNLNVPRAARHPGREAQPPCRPPWEPPL